MATALRRSGEALSATLGARVLHFPKDRMRGDALDSGCDCHAADRVVLPLERRHEWEEIGPARGDVAIPAGKRARLVVSGDGCQDMSFLAALVPDDLYDLTASGMSALGARPTDAGLKDARI